MAKVEWSVLAQEDLLSIINYISNENPVAAQRLKDEINARVGHLAFQPRAYKAGREPGTREMVVQPNYLVIYSESKMQVLVLRVLHAARQWPANP